MRLVTISLVLSALVIAADQHAHKQPPVLTISVTHGGPTQETENQHTSQSDSHDEVEWEAQHVERDEEEFGGLEESEEPEGPEDVEDDSGLSGVLGITYSPYNADNSCKTASEIASDVAKLSSFSVIRLYGIDCDQVAQVYNVKSSYQKLFVGIFDVQASIGDSCKKIKDSIKGDWSAVYSVGIGNELIQSGKADIGQIKKYIGEARSSLTQLGYTGHIVAPDCFSVFQKTPELCDVSDYISINAHAFYDPNCPASNAGNWLLSTVQSVSDICKGKKVIVSESGWPSNGAENGKAIPGPSQQKEALSSISEKIGYDTIMFTAFNDLWKSPGSFSAEQYYGIMI